MKKLLTWVVLAGAASVMSAAEVDLAPFQTEIAKSHDRSITRLKEWIAEPAIAAENLNFPAGADRMIALLKEAGFQTAKRIETDGKPGVLATLDAGAPKTLGVYFMYDVKQFDPAEWSSPPLEGRIVDKPG